MTQTNQVQPNTALMELMADNADALRNYGQLPDPVREFFNEFALAAPEDQRACREMMLQVEGGRA